MTHYADNLKKSIVTTQGRITQMIHDDNEQTNAAYREAIIRMAQEADVWVAGQEPYQAQLERFAALVAAEKDKEIKRLQDMLYEQLGELTALRAEKQIREAAQQALEVLERAGEELRWQAIGQVQRDLRTALSAESTVKDSLTVEETLRRENERLTKWIPVSEMLPNDETPVLVRFGCGMVRIGELRWEYPTFEDTYKSFRYWDDPENDGQCWEWFDITHWMPIPEINQEGVK